MLSIEILYKLTESPEWNRIQLQPSEYFWRDPDDPNQAWDIDSVPQHEHLTELLRLEDSNSLDQAVTRVTHQHSGAYFECAYHFWGGAEDYVCLVTHRRDSGTERELILVGNIPFKENGAQVARVTLGDSVPSLTMNCFMWGPGGDDHSLDMLDPNKADNALKGRRVKRAPFIAGADRMNMRRS